MGSEIQSEFEKIRIQPSVNISIRRQMTAIFMLFLLSKIKRDQVKHIGTLAYHSFAMFFDCSAIITLP